MSRRVQSTLSTNMRSSGAETWPNNFFEHLATTPSIVKKAHERVDEFLVAQKLKFQPFVRKYVQLTLSLNIITSGAGLRHNNFFQQLETTPSSVYKAKKNRELFLRQVEAKKQTF